MLLIYETMFCEILKLMSREIKRIITSNRNSMTEEEAKDQKDSKIDMKSILNSPDYHSDHVCLELSKLLMEVVAVNGAAIKSTIQHYYQVVDQSKGGSPPGGKKHNMTSSQKISPNSEVRISSHFILGRLEFDTQGDDFHDKSFKKQISSVVDRSQPNQTQLSLKVNELIDLCQSLSDFDMVQTNINNRKPKLRGSEDLMEKILVFIECNHRDLKKEAITTLKNSHLRTIYLVLLIEV